MFHRDIESISRILNRIWRADVERINDHLPKEFKTLSQLLNSDEPMVETKGGTPLIFDRNELRKLAEIIPLEMHDKVKLPFILLRRLDLGRGVFQILGGKNELYAIAKILGVSKKFNSASSITDEPFYLYKSQVFKLKRLFRTITVIGFAFSES